MNPTLLAIFFLCAVVAAVIYNILAGRKNKKTQEKHAKNAPASQSFQIVTPEFEKWNAQDAVILRQFFSTPVGQKLHKACLMKVYTESLNECSGDKAIPVAAGMNALLIFQQNLCSRKVEQDLISHAQAQEANNTTDSNKGAVSVES